MPPISADPSDGAVFRGLNNSGEGSGAIVNSQSQLNKVTVNEADKTKD